MHTVHVAQCGSSEMSFLLSKLCRQLLIRFRSTRTSSCDLQQLSRFSVSMKSPTHLNTMYLLSRGIVSSNGSSGDYKYRSSSQNPYPNDVTMATLLGMGLLMCNFRSKDDTNTSRRYLLAVKNGEKSSVRSFLKSGVDVNCRHPLGWCALHSAIMNKNWDILKLLVDEGADVNIKDEFSSATRVAHQERVHSSQVSRLRDDEFSSDINHYVSYSGFTPLHYAIIVDDIEMVRYLLDHGADPTLENNSGYKPSNYCVNDNVKALLEEYTTKIEERKLRDKLEERRKYPLEDRLRENIVGQDGAIMAAASAIRRREMGWGDEEHPMVFLFLGSSGIGKTELAKQIANYIHKDKKEGFIRLDMSEYQEKHEVAKLIGAPPGYIGYDQGGQLTSRLSECPNAVVLFDEVDKAHPDVLTVLLQLFDEGRLTDGHGKTIECKDAIFVMTSNLANDEIAHHALKLRKEASQVAKKYRKTGTEEEPEERIEISRDFKEQVVEPILKRHFKRDEFLGRINEMVYFIPFSRTELNRLVEKELHIWKERAEKRHSIRLSWTREVLDVVADGYNVKYGARSIQHEVERRIVNLLAAAYEQEEIARGSDVCLVVDSQREAAHEREPVIRLQVSGRKQPVKTIGVRSNFYA